MVGFEGNYMFYIKKVSFFCTREEGSGVSTREEANHFGERKKIKLQTTAGRFQNLVMSGGSRKWWWWVFCFAYPA